MTDEELDYKARMITVASYCYYRRDVSIMSDGDFDKMCQEVADNWDQLSDLRKFQLDNADDIRSGGSHVKITTAGEKAAIRLAKETNQVLCGCVILKWEFSEEHQVHYAGVGS